MSLIGRIRDLLSCRVVAAVLVLPLAWAQTAAHAQSGKEPDYSYFVTGTRYFEAGNPTPVRPLPQPRPKVVQPLVIMGGGPDVDEAYRWMMESGGVTRQTGGRFVVIRTAGSDAYNPYFYYSDERDSTSTPAVDGYVGGAYLGLTSAETVIITSRNAANDPFVNEVVRSANALWIAGGDQTTYIDLWKGTKLQSTLEDLLKRNIPVGGTSAGSNVLGQFVFYAANGSVTSSEALGNPYNEFMSFDPVPFSGPSFLDVPVLQNTFVDPHFDERDRMGRLVTFMSRTARQFGRWGCPGGVVVPPWQARGIGVGVETALLTQKRGLHYVARRVTNPSTTTNSAVHFLNLTVPPAVCGERKPITVYGIRAQRLADSTTEFNLTHWWNLGLGSPGIYQYSVDENAGVQSPAVIPY